MSEIRIPVTVGGVTFKNPFYVASGPTTKNVKQLLRIEETGWAAASIKLSIDPAPYINRKPRYSIFKDRNALAFTAEKRLTFEQGLALIREAKPKLHDLKLMANITYAGEEGVDGWVNMAKRFEEAGADIIELNMCCPNMSYNLEMTSGGARTASKQTGASMGQRADIASEIVSAIKQAIHIPLFVKLTPEGGKIAHVAKALYEAGADAVGGTGNRLGMPPINLDDPGQAYYHLQKEISMGCHSGAWLKPLAQRDTYEIRKVNGMDVPVTATGGITCGKDAIEMVLCGGTLLGICAETLISGYDIVRPMIADLKAYMDKHGYTDLAQMRGLVVPEVHTATDVTLYGGYARIKDPNLSAPCKSACPHHVPVQAYIQKIAKSSFREAYDLITGTNALQNVCALVCSHPCENACVRGGFDSPLKIRALKRFVLEYGKEKGWEPAWKTAEKNGFSAAVIGTGASGLAAAAALVSAGYDVTAFDASALPGGNLRKAVPDFVYDKAVLDEEIRSLEENGVKFVAASSKTALEALAEGFDHVIVAEDVTIPEPVACDGKKAVVWGSGIQAVYTARDLLRQGAAQVTLLLKEKIPTKGAVAEELAAARQEGISVLDDVTACVKEENECRVTVKGLEMKLEAPVLAECEEIQAKAFPEMNHVTVIPGCGMPGRMMEDITAGKNAAAEADAALRKEQATLQKIQAVRTVNVEKVRERIGYLKRDPNPVMLTSLDENGLVSLPRMMTMEEAIREASRCLNCGCGEGCQLCKTICCDFAPEVASPDCMQINKEACVACGMCFNRCPNGNIEMVNTGEIL